MYRGTILAYMYDVEKVNGVITDDYLWRVKYDNPDDDDDFADYGAEDMKQSGARGREASVGSRKVCFVGIYLQWLPFRKWNS